MIALRDADEYTDEEIDEKYRDDVDAGLNCRRGRRVPAGCPPP